MRETVEKMLASLREYWAKLPRRTRIRLGILVAAVIVLAIVVVAVLSRTVWVTLPGSGDAINNNAIYEVLLELNIPTRTVGNTIEVPEDRLEDAQSNLRARGVMSASAFDTFYLEQAAGFGVSQEHADALYAKQLGDDIRVQLLQNNRVQNALVIVSPGETSPFRIQTSTRQATANVQIILRDGGTLTDVEVRGITELVRTSVPGIEYENISITDQEFRAYSVLDEEDNPQATMDEYDMRIMLQNRLAQQFKTQTEQFISPVFGEDNIGVMVNVKLNFDRMVTEEILFDPPIPGNEEGIVRSSEEIYERSRMWGVAEGIPGTDPNGMGAVEYPYGDFDENDYYLRDVRNLNFEINETRRAIEHASGVVEDLSVGVLINSDYLLQTMTEEDLESPEFLDFSAEIADGIAKGLGIPLSNVSVQYMPFIPDTTLQDWRDMQAEREAQQQRERIVDLVLQYGTILLLFVMIYMLGREIARAMRPPPEPEMILMAEGPGMGIDMIIGEETAAVAPTVVEEEKEKEPELEPIDIDLNVKSAGLEQIEKFIDKDAALVTQMLRNWISDE